MELRLCVFILLVSFSAPIDLSDECRKPVKRVSSRDESVLLRSSIIVTVLGLVGGAIVTVQDC